MNSGSGAGKSPGRGGDGGHLRPVPLESWSPGGVSGSNALSAFDSEDGTELPGALPQEPAARASGESRRTAASPIDTGKTSSTLSRPKPPAKAAPLPQVARTAPGSRKPIVWTVVGIAAVLASVTALLVAYPRLSAPVTATTPTVPVVVPAHVTIETMPPGAEVLLLGQPQGLTPMKLALEPGHHELVLRRGIEERALPIDVTAGTEVLQRIDFPVAAPVVGAKLLVSTEPPGARVMVDGQPRGVTPVTIADVTIGRHRVSVSSAGGSAERNVTTEAGATMSVMFSLPNTPAMDVGWLTVVSPFEVKVVERDDVLGTSASSKIIVTSGVHEVDLVSTAVGYQTHRRVTIEPGKAAEVRIEARTTVNVNARPWADVTIDGASAGPTPLANLSLNLGTHQVLFKHPQLGERTQEILVTQQGPNRFSVDMTK